MNLLKIYPVFLLILFAACAGKGGHGSKPDTTNDSAAIADSIKAEKLKTTPLPDTVFESVATITYNIEIADTTDDGTIALPDDSYLSAPGHLTFRNGPRRDADFGGRVNGAPDDIVIDWEFTTDFDTRETSHGTWGGGTGWTGQPLYVEWPDSMMAKFRNAGLMNGDAGKREIIVGSLASQIYFIDFETGKPSRQSISVENPVKGTMSLDPNLNGNLYVGLGIPAVRPFGSRVVDLTKGQISHIHPEDPKAHRHWDAYDSSPLRVGRFLFWPGENGTLYKFAVSPGKLKLHSALRYSVAGSGPGIENSISVYRNYGYFGDNHGNVLCVNLNTMKPVWHYRIGDDVDATTVVTIEDNQPFVYASCEVDRQADGDARFVKLDALTGREIWMTSVKARKFNIGDKHFDGGFFASPLPGDGDCSHLIFNNVVLNSGTDSISQRQNGRFVAFNRKDGSISYKTDLKYYAWSSPVGFLNEDGKQYILTGDCAGNLYLIDGLNGEIICRKPVGANFESSPVVIGNSAVVGSRGDKIFKVSIK